MKKRMIGFVLFLFVSLLLFFVLRKPPESDANYIGVLRAKEISTSLAGTNETDAVFTRVDLLRDNSNGVYYYIVEFCANGGEYSYKLAAETGQPFNDIDF